MDETITYTHSASPKQIYFDQKSFRVGNLSEEERRGLFRTYGYQIEDVRALDESEEWLFSGQEIVSPEFYLQSLYKIKGTILPEKFTDAVKRVVKRQPVLRQNFYAAGERYLKVILRERMPVIIYRTLSGHPLRELDSLLENIMEADLRRGFDLMHDRLFRLAVFRTGREEYAVVITQPQVIADGWNAAELFREAMGSGVVEAAQNTSGQFARYLQKNANLSYEPALLYWKKLLAGLPEMPALPGYTPSYQPYVQEVSHCLLNLADMEDLRLKSREERDFLIAILQTAWGIMLQQVNHCEDTYFCLVMANRQSRLHNIAAMAGVLHMLPIRVQSAQEALRVRDLVKQQFQQQIVSQPYSYCRKQDFQRVLGRQQEMFNHFLSFHGFFIEARRYTKTEGIPEGRAVMLNSRDAKGMDLGVYFHYNGETISMDFLYHNQCFSKEAIENLAEYFKKTLHLLLDGWERSIFSLRQALRKEYQVLADSSPAKKAWSGPEISGFLSRQSLFAAASGQTLQELAAAAVVKSYLENDTVQQSRAGEPQLLFVWKGTVVRNLNAGTGWFSMLDVKRDGALLNAYSFLPEMDGKLLLEVFTEKAEILSIPLNVVKRCMGSDAQISQNMLSYVLRELVKYQQRWIRG